MKYLRLIVLSSFFLFSGCMIPQGANDCIHNDIEKSAICFSFHENGQGFVYKFFSGNQVKMNIEKDKTYLISPNGTRYRVANTKILDEFSEQSQVRYYNTTMIFSDYKGRELTDIESGHWQVFLTYALSDEIEREVKFEFDVSKSLYIPFVMRPN